MDDTGKEGRKRQINTRIWNEKYTYEIITKKRMCEWVPAEV
jgi:hypothetical protein